MHFPPTLAASEMTSLRVLLLSLAVCLFLGHGSAQLTFANCHSDPDNPGQPGPWSWVGVYRWHFVVVTDHEAADDQRS